MTPGRKKVFTQQSRSPVEISGGGLALHRAGHFVLPLLLVQPVLLLGHPALGQDSRDLALHEGPGYVGAPQRTPLAARTEDLPVSAALLLDGLRGAGEAELVLGRSGTLDKVSVLQSLGADCALQ
jgi:hypothetical protein